MRFLKLPPCTREQQVEIGRQYLRTRVLASLHAQDAVTITDGAVEDLVLRWPASPRMRGLERRLREAVTGALQLVLAGTPHVSVDQQWVREHLRAPVVSTCGVGFRPPSPSGTPGS